MALTGDLREMADNRSSQSLNLLAGEIVEVRNRDEILASLDQNGKLDAMPFMPEMLQYCGKRFRVFKRADKTCDTVGNWSLRRVRNAVHLIGVRCDGASHANCDAGCLIFWKEAWLKRVECDFLSASQVRSLAPSSGRNESQVRFAAPACTEQRLTEAVFERNPVAPAEPLYTCQATQLPQFSSFLHWWDLRHYVRDIRAGNLRRGMGISRSGDLLETILGVLEVARALVIAAFNKVQDIRDGVRYPHIAGSLDATPTAELKLQPGDFVEVRSKEEIMATLDNRSKNRGLLFDSEMLRYCGGTYRVLKRVNQIVDEKSGKILKMKSPCIILEGVACISEYHHLCPRSIHHYWREVWLRRVE